LEAGVGNVGFQLVVSYIVNKTLQLFDLVALSQQTICFIALILMDGWTWRA